MVVSSREHSVSDVAVNMREDQMPVAFDMAEEVMLAAVNMAEEAMPAKTHNDLEVPGGGFAWAEVLEYGEATVGPPMTEEEEKEHFITIGCDPNRDEPAGVNEEWRYFKCVDQGFIDPIENRVVEVQKRKRARPIPEIREFDNEVVPDDEATMLGDFIVPHTSHDEANPTIKVGDTFADKNAFIHTIKQYAIRNEFETRLEHSDKERYRVRCADAACEWRVYAKKLHGCNTFMVVKLTELDVHTCPSTSKMKGREASIAWISQKVKDVVKDPTLSATKLQKRLEKHYNIQLSYFKVWSSRKFAMEDLHGTWEESFKMLWRFKAALEES
ncbi:unnamed protein product [Urochloa humidicola]